MTLQKPFLPRLREGAVAIDADSRPSADGPLEHRHGMTTHHRHESPVGRRRRRQSWCSAVTGLSPRSASHYATLAAGMIIITGIAFVAAGFLRLGFITEFLSRPVMRGFVFGLAIFVSVSQLPKILGLGKGEGDTLRQLGH